jgi:ABC-2 type transport system ATP-binding protein
MSTSPGNGPAIELHGLTKCFGTTLAVANLSLAVERGSTLGLIGPNGAGKTTTLKILMGILAPTGGEVRVLGTSPQANPTWVKRRVGYVPEVQHIYRWMRVRQVIGFCRSLYEGSWNDETCQRMFELFRLDPNKKVKHLSKGMLVKLSLLLALCDRGQTVLFSTHTLDDVQRMADTVAVLYEGRLLLHSKIEQLVSTTKRIRAVLSDGQRPGQVPAGTVWDRIEGREWLITVRDFSPEKVQQVRALNGVDHVEVIDLGLEDVFKDIVKGQRAAK